MKGKDFLAEARRQNGITGVTNINWSHNCTSSGKILWGNDPPVDYWESADERYNGICVIRRVLKEKDNSRVYTIVFKDHQVFRTGEEREYRRAILFALNTISGRMEELLVNYKIEDGQELFDEIAKELTAEFKENTKPNKIYTRNE